MTLYTCKYTALLKLVFSKYTQYLFLFLLNVLLRKRK